MTTLIKTALSAAVASVLMVGAAQAESGDWVEMLYDRHEAAAVANPGDVFGAKVPTGATTYELVAEVRGESDATAYRNIVASGQSDVTALSMTMGSYGTRVAESTQALREAFEND